MNHLIEVLSPSWLCSAGVSGHYPVPLATAEPVFRSCDERRAVNDSRSRDRRQSLPKSYQGKIDNQGLGSHVYEYAESPILGLQCRVHKIPRRSPSEIATRTPGWVPHVDRTLRTRVVGNRPRAADETARHERQDDGGRRGKSDLRKGHRKSECSDHHGSVRRFSMPCVPRIF